MAGIEAFPVQDILRLVEHHGGLEPRIFGSRARGDARTDSDLDLLIKAGPRMSLFDVIGLQQDLEELLGIHIEVVTEGSLHPLLREEIIAEARPSLPRNDDRILLYDIRRAAERIVTYTTGGRAEFLNSPMIQDAVIRNLEIVGEAGGKVSEPARTGCRRCRGGAPLCQHEVRHFPAPNH
jgi:uncharacterized protein